MKKMVNTYNRHKELILFSLVYLGWTIIELKIKLFLTPTFFDGTLEYNHHQLLLFQYFNNEQSRILQWFIPQLFVDFFQLNIFQAYVLQRLVFIFFAFILFHFYLRKWFSSIESLAGVAFFAVIMPFTFMNDLQESSSLLLVTFLLALWAIRNHNFFLLFVATAIGVANNESMIVLPVAYFLYHYSLKLNDLLRLIGKMLILSLSLVPLIIIRIVTWGNPHLGGPYYILPDNIVHMISDFATMDIFNLYSKSGLYIFLIFGVLWLIPFMNFSGKPLFLKRTAYLVPIFVICNLITGITSEVRQMLPLSFIIIPAFLFYIKTLDTKSDVSNRD